MVPPPRSIRHPHFDAVLAAPAYADLHMGSRTPGSRGDGAGMPELSPFPAPAQALVKRHLVHLFTGNRLRLRLAAGAGRAVRRRCESLAAPGSHTGRQRLSRLIWKDCRLHFHHRGAWAHAQHHVAAGADQVRRHCQSQNARRSSSGHDLSAIKICLLSQCFCRSPPRRRAAGRSGCCSQCWSPPRASPGP